MKDTAQRPGLYAAPAQRRRTDAPQTRSFAAEGKHAALQARVNASPTVQRLATLQRVANGAAQTAGPVVQRTDEVEMLQGKMIQREAIDEEDLLQGKMIQREAMDEEEPLQGKMNQREAVDEEELLQGKAMQRRETGGSGGLPDPLRSGIEGLSGLSMEGVKVHRNSAAPAQVGALAYAQGRDIHLGPGQERHLPHEAWHVVQQAQGRVRPTMQAKGVAINDNPALEAEADGMGLRAVQLSAATHEPTCSCASCIPRELPLQQAPVGNRGPAVQRYCGHPYCDDEQCNDRRNHQGPVPFGGSEIVGRSRTIRTAEQDARFSHVTREQHVDSILSQGLQASRGGSGGAGAALGGAAGASFRNNSRGYVHVGQDAGQGDSAPSAFYERFYANRDIETRTLTVYPPREALSALQPDPDDQAGGRYRTPQDIPAGQIYSSPPSVPAAGARGPVFLPGQMEESIRARLPPRRQGTSRDEMVAGMRDDVPTLRDIQDARTRDDLVQIARRLRVMAAQGYWENGSSEEYQQLSQAVRQRIQ